MSALRSQKKRTPSPTSAARSAAGGRVLGLSLGDPVTEMKALNDGLPYNKYVEVQRRTTLPSEQLARAIGVAPRTLTRRRESGRFTPAESERLLRVARTFERVAEFMAGDAAAARWFTSPKAALGGELPIDVVGTEAGARAIDNMIGRAEDGIVS